MTKHFRNALRTAQPLLEDTAPRAWAELTGSD
jgi:hypothetical protein